MFYILMYALLTFTSFTILISSTTIFGDVAVLLLTSIVFFLMYKRYIKDLGGKEKAKAYHKSLINNDFVLKEEVVQSQDEAMENPIIYKDVSIDTSPVVINDKRFFVSAKRWRLLLFVFFMADLFTPYLSNWSFYIFSIMNFIMIFITMAPFVMESYHGFKRTGLKKVLQWTTFGVAAIFVLNVLNGYVFELVNFRPDSGNQTIIESMLQADFLRVTFQVTFTAAIIEELVFRGIFFRNLFTKNKFLAYVVTFLAFGVPHLLVGLIEGAGLSEFMYLPIYGGMGVIFAYIYSKTNSVFTAMGAHLINNLVSVIALLLV